MMSDSNQARTSETRASRVYVRPAALAPFDRMTFACTPGAQEAFGRFHTARLLVVLCVLLAAISVSHIYWGTTETQLGMCLAFLVLAAVI